MPSLTRSARYFDFQDLMRHRVGKILLVASPYDAFVLAEAGELGERLLGEFRNIDLHYAPGLTSAATGAEALALAAEDRFDLILATPELADMNAAELAATLRAAGVTAPIVLLAWDSREIRELAARHDLAAIERAYVWLGDARILMAIVKAVEDRANAAHDVGELGVQVILLVEDSLRNYSAFLPVIYSELFHHSRRLIGEGANFAEKILRMRARPKILLATSAEEAEAAFDAFHGEILGVISDIEFPRRGVKEPEAGVELAHRVRARHPDIPIILHSSRAENAALAESVGASFLLKGSGLVLDELRRVILEDFGFGDFVFRIPDAPGPREVARARDLGELEAALASVPSGSIVYHAERNHFSRWLKARTEFALAQALRPRRAEDYASAEALRDDLIATIAAYRDDREQRVVADFDRSRFGAAGSLARIGGGSLGGKARGLAFVRRLLADSGLRRRFPGVEIGVPRAIVLGTNLFDRFLDDNDLRGFAVDCEDDAELERRFEDARLPDDVERELAAYLELEREPLAVRSSSLLEDSQHLPFSGVYDTRMLANEGSPAARLRALATAVKRVYASTFSRPAKGYLAATAYRLEEEKMAVLVQRLVGRRFGSGAPQGARFYPDFAGVARSHNFYPAPPAGSADGVAAVALGFGRTVVEGGACVRFCPRYPLQGPQYSTYKALLDASQRGFWALPLGTLEPVDATAGEMRESWYGLDAAEADGTLGALASTYSVENEALYDGLSRSGVRAVTFAPLLRQGSPPLAEILVELLAEGRRGMGAPVEIEFAVALADRPGAAHEFALLQMRPLSLARERESVTVPEIGLGEPAELGSDLLGSSPRALGHGHFPGIRDVVVVDQRRFERAQSREAASEIARLNARLAAARTPYLLIGVGRWGSRDPWLGIPVSWDQVAGAAVIVEAGLRDLEVTPSEGSHFFHNLSSFGVGFLTVSPASGLGFLDWEWLDAQPARSESARVRHLRLERPLSVRIDGRRGRGVIEKPRTSAS